MSAPQIAKDIESLEAHLRAEFARGDVDVPLLPDVAANVLSSAVDEHSDAVKMAQLIEQDQSLASHILRIVNSPVFRGSADIVSLQQAVARLGMERLREIAMTVSIKGALVVPQQFAEPVEMAWRTGLRTGLWAKEVARSARKNVETAYLCGLLHNVGVAVVVNQICAVNDTLDRELMEQLIDRLHPSAGSLLIQKWNLPEVVGLCIENLDQPAVEGLSIPQEDALRVLQVSCSLAALTETEAPELETLFELDCVAHLNLYPDDLQQLYTHAEAISETLRGMQ